MYRFIYLFLSFILLANCPAPQEKTVFVTILAKNKAHTLKRYLQCLENQDYPKKAMTLYICTNDNKDQTQEILENWIQKKEHLYNTVFLETPEFEDFLEDQTPLYNWQFLGTNPLAQIKQRSLDLAMESQCDYYFVYDCNSFISPITLKTLVNKNLPIVAPMLYAIPEKQDPYSNYFCAIDLNGYYKVSSMYWQILHRKMIGTFEVPLVHCTYLIRSDMLDQLSYIDQSNRMEFVVFADNARKANIKQYICNEEDFGVLLHFFEDPSFEEESAWAKNILMLP